LGLGEDFAHFLGRSAWLQSGAEAAGHGMNVVLMVGSTLFVLAGIGLAAWMYVLQPGLPGKLAASLPLLYQLSLNKVGPDALYRFAVVRPLEIFAAGCRAVDTHIVGGLVDLGGDGPASVGQAV